MKRTRGGVKKSKADILRCRPTGACSPCSWKDTLIEVVAMKVRVGGSIILVEGVGMVLWSVVEVAAVLPWSEVEGEEAVNPPVVEAEEVVNLL